MSGSGLLQTSVIRSLWQFLFYRSSERSVLRFRVGTQYTRPQVLRLLDVGHE